MPSTHNLPDAQARQESLDLLPEYLHDEVEFISLEKFFERIYHWGINGLRWRLMMGVVGDCIALISNVSLSFSRPDMTKASPQPPQPPAPSHPSQPDQSVKQQQQLQVQQMHEEKGKEMDLDQAETQVEQMEEKNGEEMLVTIQQEIKEASSPALLTTIHREEEEAAVAVIGEEQHLQ